ncbi:hypothetical protein [Agromyces aerolatus]|uniref:hypothetical protein n=1 Tax=Agromyces sp. LY-1074 TaxID=3074080 RepID=UPI00285F3310|nr:MULTISPECIES: hypothetical protein [unclassified Agromyces]MDR5701367.1 hypothetical protein [Agromyces sp. LY-1074]MDR5706844.1 hypothetical protein [Agromyces sp. LY-1358]
MSTIGLQEKTHSGRWTGDEDGIIGLTVRETRLVVERNLLVLGLPQSENAPVRDLMLEAQAIGLPVVDILADEFDELLARNSPVLTVTERIGARAWVDGGGSFSLFVAPGIVDLAVEIAAHHGWAVISVRGVSHPELLAALTASAWRYGLGLVATVGGATTVSRHDGAVVDATGEAVIVVGRNAHDVGPEGRALLAGGASLLHATVDRMPVPAASYWRIYDRALLALAEDNEVSARHAGPTMVDAQGRVHGETLEEL